MYYCIDLCNINFILFQDIYNEVTQNEPEKVKEELTLARCQKSMTEARAKLIPPCPDTLDELIPKLELNEYPASYQKLYLGHVKWEQTLSRASQSSQSSSRRRKTHYSIIIGDRDLIETVMKIAVFYFGDATFRIVCRQARRGSKRSSQVIICTLFVDRRIPFYCPFLYISYNC